MSSLTRKTRKIRKILFFTGAIFLSVWSRPAPVLADLSLGRARLYPLPLKTKTQNPQVIEGLTFDPQTAEISLSHDKKIHAKITGRFSEQDWSLVLRSEQYNALSLQGSEGRFEFEIPISGRSTEFELLAISARGEVRHQQTLIYFSDWDRVQKELKAQPPKTVLSGLDVGLSATSISLSQTNVGDFDEIALTAKVGYQHTLFSPSWEWSLSGFGTLLPLAESYPATARFFGTNFRVGYHIPGLSDPWLLKVWLGGYYTTTIVTNNLFGYQNTVGPEIYTSLQKTLASGNSVQGYFKFALVSNNIPNFAPGNHEIALGVAYSHTLANGHALSASLDGSLFSLLSNAVQIDVTTISLGAGYGF